MPAKPPASVPSSHPSVIERRHGKLTLSIWDLGGEDRLRVYWRHHFLGAQAVVFVLDASDTSRLDVATEELRACNTDAQLDGIPFVIFANKSDVAGALSPDEVRDAMKLEA